jgi:hypothetical protein
MCVPADGAHERLPQQPRRRLNVLQRQPSAREHAGEKPGGDNGEPRDLTGKRIDTDPNTGY